MPELPDPSNMPKVPEPLQTPVSLGGLAERAGVDSLGESEVLENAAAEDQVIESLRERTEEWTEDIDEKEKVIFNDSQDENEALEEDPQQVDVE